MDTDSDMSDPTGARSEVVRITTLHAGPGQAPALAAAAEENARAARHASGCLSAEVCSAADRPATVLVVSRWESEPALRAFLDWHEALAHGSVSRYVTRTPHSVHYRVTHPDA